MATSLHDLLAALEAALRIEAGQLEADDAVAALAYLARGLQRLADDGVDMATTSGRRTASVGELARACHAAANAWSGLPHGRLTDLAGATADVVDLIRSEMGGNERWAAAIELSATSRRCAGLAERHPPYHGIPPLTRVRRLAGTVEQLAAAQPPAPHRQTALDVSVPVAGLPAGLPGSRITAEATAAVADQLRRMTGSDRGPPRLAEVLAVLRAAESTARYGTALAIALEPTAADSPAAQATAGWRAARRALDRFDDGTRRHPGEASPLILWAVRQHEGLRREFGRPDRVAETIRTLPDLARAATDSRAATNQLPGIATTLHTVIGQWAGRGQLVARAGRLEPRAARYTAIVRNAPIAVDAEDLVETLGALHTARLLSIALAAQLDRPGADAGKQPQPHMIASFNTTLASPTAAQELTRRARLLRLSAPPAGRPPRPSSGSPTPVPRR